MLVLWNERLSYVFLDSLPLISLKNLRKNGAKKLVWAASCTVAYNAFYNELPGLPYIRIVVYTLKFSPCLQKHWPLHKVLLDFSLKGHLISWYIYRCLKNNNDILVDEKRESRHFSSNTTVCLLWVKLKG